MSYPDGLRVYDGDEPTPCAMCVTAVEPGQDAQPIGTPEGRGWAHRECLLRTVTGGIGHLTNHAYWCTEMHDPDGGMSFRESAIAVDHWVREGGTA